MYLDSSYVTDKSRIQKSLHTNHPAGMTPVLRAFPTEHAEAAFIAVECKRLVAEMGGALNWGDFVVLRELLFSLHNDTCLRTVVVRFNALSRVIESALQREGIPNRVLGGHKFFERLEVCPDSLGQFAPSPCLRSRIYWHISSWLTTRALTPLCCAQRTCLAEALARRWVRTS